MDQRHLGFIIIYFYSTNKEYLYLVRLRYNHKAQLMNFPTFFQSNKKIVLNPKNYIMFFPPWHLNQCKNVSWSHFCGGL